PTAKPIINLPMTSVDIFGAAANINAPTAKTIEIIKTKRRLPNLSDKGPLKPEPKIAPINMELTTNPSVKSDRGMSVFMYNNAPEMTLMSYPYKSSPSAPKKKFIFLLILPSIFCSFFLDVILARYERVDFSYCCYLSDTQLLAMKLGANHSSNAFT